MLKIAAYLAEILTARLALKGGFILELKILVNINITFRIQKFMKFQIKMIINTSYKNNNDTSIE